MLSQVGLKDKRDFIGRRAQRLRRMKIACGRGPHPSFGYPAAAGDLIRHGFAVPPSPKGKAYFVGEG